MLEKGPVGGVTSLKPIFRMMMLGAASVTALSTATAQVAIPPAEPAPVTATPPTAATAPVEGSPAAPAADRPTLDAQTARENNVGEIVVTGSRITASGFNAPTPTTVLSIEAIQQAGQPNVFQTIAQLPALQGSTGTTNATQNGNTSIGSTGLSALNMRGLGAIRTLTLLDGQRVVPAYVTGVVDVSQFPQLLIQRVDVVTGGASASWGSDAISGVVNFVTDKKFKGIKANVQGGISTYGDDRSILAQVAAGEAFFDDKLHIELSGEYFDNKGVPAGDVGGKQVNGRPDAYRSGSTSYALGAQPAGSPQYYYYPYNAQDITLGRTGLITAGPLQGTAFGANGQITTFQYGGSGTPSRAATPAVVGCVASVCQGGEQSNYLTTATVDDPIRRLVGYGRVGYDIAPTVELFGTVNVSQVKTSNQPIAFPRRPGLTIACSNPLLPAAIPTACAAAGITSFLFGTVNASLPAREKIYSKRTLQRYVGGADGSFNLFGKPVSFDAHYEHGENKARIDIDNIILLPRFSAAINPTRNAAGQIVCTSAAAVAAGCLPVNIFGDFPISSAQYSYLAPANGPYQNSLFKEDSASASFNATPFKNWAGDVAIALGAEYRRETYKVTADPYGNGVSADSPNTADYPADSLLSAAGNNWFAGNYHSGGGKFHVTEGFVELGVPLWNSEALGKLDLNVAGRIADYSSSGTAKTWKVGGTWDTPLNGLRVRGVLSRDIRAPNLSELYAAPQSQTQFVINRANNVSTQVLIQTLGNSNLKPEVSRNREVGFVYRPDFLRNLVFSVDYFNINVRKAISTLTAQQIEDLCFNGNAAFCGGINFAGVIGTANYPYVIVQPFNLASIKTSGIDFEASYRIDLGHAGRIDLHGLATRTLDFTSSPGVAGQIIQQNAGNNNADTPYWKANLREAWTLGTLTFSLTERIVSAGKINPNYITCQTGCPASTVQNPTTNFNHIPGAFYLDIGATYNPAKWLQIYGRIDNVANHRIPPFGSTTIYDVIGRTFRLGARFNG